MPPLGRIKEIDMAEPTEYSESPEIKELATKLKDRYYLHLGHVELDLVYFAEKTGSKPKKGRVGEISGISNAWVKQILSQFGNNQQYCLSVWTAEWEALSPGMREWLIFDALYSIKPEQDGKLRKPDVSEHGPILEFMMGQGIGYLWRNGESDLPSLLGDTPLAIPLPADTSDTSDSTL